jgi:hypothetical protein
MSGAKMAAGLAVIALTGFGWMLWLVASEPSTAFGDGTSRCFSVLTAPTGQSNRDSRTNLDDEARRSGVTSDTGVTELIDRCARLRARRLGISVLVTPGVAACLAGAAVAMSRGGRNG